MATIWADGLVAPHPTLIASDGTTCNLVASIPTLVANSGTTAYLTAPHPTLLASDSLGYVIRTAPIPTLTANDGFPSVAQLTAPVPQLLASDGLGVMRGVAPAPRLIAAFGTIVQIVAPSPLLVATFANTASGHLTASLPLLVATLASQNVITVAGIAPAPMLSANVAVGGIITADLVNYAPLLTASGYSGNVLAALLTAASPILSAAGYTAITIKFAGTAPAPRLGAVYNPQNLSPIVLPPTLGALPTVDYRTWVLNTRKDSLTEYNNFQFNSYAYFNGQVLACGPAGVVSLDSQYVQDGTTPIDAVARTGAASYGSSFLKRVPRIYVSGAMGGDMYFRSITSEGGVRTYRLTWNNTSGPTQRRVPIGKGPKSKFFQFELENIDGADFSIDSIVIYPNIIRRRVQ